LDDITDAGMSIGKGLAKTIIDGTEQWDYVPAAAISHIPALVKLNESLRIWRMTAAVTAQGPSRIMVGGAGTMGY
jgi:hypothetical protein